MIKTPHLAAAVPLLMGCPRRTDSWVLGREGERSHPFTVFAKQVEWRGNWALWGLETVVVSKVPSRGLVFWPH